MIKKIYHALSLVVILLALPSCKTSIFPHLLPLTLPEPVAVQIQEKKIDYLNDVKPLLDKRCVSCHSCYNSPCQTKLSSFEGLDRGASKTLVYDSTRLKAINPTRLFVDAKNTQEWRKKGFFSVTENFTHTEASDTTAYNDSIMLLMLNDKKQHPDIIGDYSPEFDKLICPKNKKEAALFFAEKPNHGMPYGFPALNESDYKIIAQWLQQGGKGPTQAEQQQITSPSSQAAIEIAKWEQFLNRPDAKYLMTARYLYEHFFLAHINFDAAPSEFYKIVRSTTPAPQSIDVIATIRPFEDPGRDVFYYRFQRIHSTIVHKTHIVLQFDDKKLARINELFISPEWQEVPHRVDYDLSVSSNPFLSFKQIPTRSRYQFMLDHNHYFMTTFIRGPVCRGQIALNVLHDQTWVMFQEPDYDLAVQKPDFLLQQSENLSLPIKKISKNVLTTFSDSYRKKYTAYYSAKQALYNKVYPNGLGLEGIWKGNIAEDSPLLTVYRHFDSASVHRGVIGSLPRTLWVIDYPQFERIYYTLAAGYDVYGNVAHQTNIRRYTDFLRMEGEINFLAYLPEKARLDIYKSWYLGDKKVQNRKQMKLNRGTGIVYKTLNYKDEFVQQVVNSHILKASNIHFDTINYFEADEKAPMMPKQFTTFEDIENGARSLTVAGTGFIKHIVSSGANTAHLKIVFPDGKSYMGTLVINRWHDNVNSLFGEQKQLDSSKDTIDFINGSIGSYINVFGIVHYDDLPDFFDLLANFDGSESYIKKLKKYFINRSNPNFWEAYDWFQADFEQSDPLQAGLYDLNRYYKEAW